MNLDRTRKTINSYFYKEFLPYFITTFLRDDIMAGLPTRTRENIRADREALGRRALVPWSGARKMAKALAVEEANLERLEGVRSEEIVRKEVREGTINRSPEATAVAGGFVVEFTNALQRELTSGQERTQTGLDGDASIRRVLCNGTFVAGILNTIRKTPLEEKDSQYANAMTRVRQNLGAKLAAGSNPAHTIPALNAQEWDIIYVTASELQQRNEVNAIDEIITFAEQVGLRRYAADSNKNPGEFVASVLADLATKVTISDDSPAGTRSKLIDDSPIKSYLDNKANAAIEDAVGELKQITRIIRLDSGQLGSVVDSFRAGLTEGLDSTALKQRVVELVGAEGELVGRIGEAVDNIFGRLNKRKPGSLTDGEWIKSISVWERRPQGIASPPMPNEGKMERAGKAIAYLATAEAWLRLVAWLWDKSFKTDFEHLTHPTDKIMTTDQNGIARPTWMPRIFKLIPRMLTRYVVYGLILGSVTGTTLIGGPYYYAPERSWAKTWTWLAAQEKDRKIVRTITDGYENPKKLTKREDDYYKKTFGLDKRTGSETDDNGINDRVNWLKEHPEVLTYLQEHVTGRKILEYKELHENPDTCGVVGGAKKKVAVTAGPQPKVSKSCDKLGVTTVQQVEEYQPVDKDDKWKPGKTICCLIDMEVEPVADGLRLNPHFAAQFVAELKEVSDKGTNVDRAYLEDVDRRASLVEKGILISESQKKIMDECGIKEYKNAQFVATQGVFELLRPRCKKGEAVVFIPEDKRDAYVATWIATVQKVQPGVDPIAYAISEDVIKQTDSAILSAGVSQQILVDSSALYKQTQIRKKFEVLDFKTQTAVDILVAQPDIAELLEKFIKDGASYKVNPARSDELVAAIARYKSTRKNIGDFDPFTDPPGVMVKGALGNGLVTTTQTEIKADKKPQIKWDDDTKKFYETNASLDGIVDAILTIIQKEAVRDGSDSELIEKLTKEKFNGKKDDMVQYFKAAAKDFLTSKDDDIVKIRDGSGEKGSLVGMKITGEGNDMKVDIAASDVKKARDAMRQRLHAWLTEQK